MYYFVTLCPKYFVVLLVRTSDLHSVILFKFKLKSAQRQGVKSTVWNEISYLAERALIAFLSANRGANSTSHYHCPAAEDVPVGMVHALSPVETRLADTLIDVGFTEVPEEAGGAGAGEAPQGIAAGCTIQARLWQALIDFQLTVCTFQSKENKQTPNLGDS